MSFKIEKLPFGEFEIIRVESLYGGDILSVCNYGATVTSYQYKHNDKITDILVPYQTPEELKKGEAAVNWIMAPFSNRMRNGQYSFHGKLYQLDDISGKSHGVVKNLLFTIDEIASNQNEALLRLSTHITPEMFSAYPFTLTVSVTYRFMQNSLDITIIGSNPGTASIPFGCGWHPYFYFEEHGINSVKLYIPSDEVIITDDSLVPLFSRFIEQLRPGHPKYFADSAAPEVLHTKSVNACYTNLKKNERGKISSRLIDPQNKSEFTIYQERGVFYAYTPEKLRGESRKAIALEPVEFMTDAFNRPELEDKILLAPGQKRSFNFGIIRETLH